MLSLISMRILFFDTETNGLPPRDRSALISDVEKWPHIVQLAWQFWDFTNPDAVCLEKRCEIIKPPETLEWNEVSAGIHGISKAKALEVGVPASELFAAFVAVASTANVIVAHNLAFDRSILKAAMVRENPSASFLWWPSHDYCTMDSTKAMCKLPSKSKFPKASDPYKWPTLGELHSFLFGNNDGFKLHSADGDVNCMVKCFQELVKRRHVPIDTWRRVLASRAAAAAAATAKSEISVN